MPAGGMMNDENVAPAWHTPSAATAPAGRVKVDTKARASQRLALEGNGCIFTRIPSPQAAHVYRCQFFVAGAIQGHSSHSKPLEVSLRSLHRRSKWLQALVHRYGWTECIILGSRLPDLVKAARVGEDGAHLTQDQLDDAFRPRSLQVC